MAMLAVGLALLGGAAWAYYALITRPLSWPRVAARVVSSRVVNPTNPTEHRPEIVFELSDGGRSRRITTVASWSSSAYDVVRRYVDGYPPGVQVEVAVNPADPDDIRYELGPTLTNLIVPGVLGALGAIFAAIGAVSAFWRRRAARADAGPRSLRWVSGLFVAIGIVVGGVGAWLWSRGTALDWPEVDATVVDGGVIYVGSSSTGKGSSRSAYDIQVTFTYQANGERVTSRTTSGDSNSSRSTAVARLQAYAPGSHHRVRHRPDDPNVVRFEVTAFKERMLPLALLLMGIVFAGLGAVAGKTLGTRIAPRGAR
jgi:Protein of unknown function (DUF3592)